MALLPTPGNVDLLVASELLEAGRAAQNGMITPDRTTVIASTHRMFAIAEKSAMGDGRFNDERVRRAVRELSRRHVLTDLGKVAERASTVLSSVLLGAVAGSGALPIPRERLRAAIERAGIAVEANQRGFDAGFRLFDEAKAVESDRAPIPNRVESAGGWLPTPRRTGSRPLSPPAWKRCPSWSASSPAWASSAPSTTRMRATEPSTSTASNGCSRGPCRRPPRPKTGSPRSGRPLGSSRSGCVSRTSSGSRTSRPGGRASSGCGPRYGRSPASRSPSPSS